MPVTTGYGFTTKIKEAGLDQRIKQRLIGAVILLSLAVIFLPIIFDGRQSKIDTAPYKLPPQPRFSNIEQPLELQPEQVQDVEAELDQLADTQEAVQASPDIETAAGYLGKERLNDQAIRAKPAKDIKLETGWIIQVGAFKEEQNANQLRSELLAAGFRAYTQQAAQYYRVYVGPLIRSFQLDEQKQRLEQEFHLQTLVLEYHP